MGIKDNAARELEKKIRQCDAELSVEAGKCTMGITQRYRNLKKDMVTLVAELDKLHGKRPYDPNNINDVERAGSADFVRKMTGRE